MIEIENNKLYITEKLDILISDDISTFLYNSRDKSKQLSSQMHLDKIVEKLNDDKIIKYNFSFLSDAFEIMSYYKNKIYFSAKVGIDKNLYKNSEKKFNSCLLCSSAISIYPIITDFNNAKLLEKFKNLREKLK